MHRQDKQSSRLSVLKSAGIRGQPTGTTGRWSKSD